MRWTSTVERSAARHTYSTGAFRLAAMTALWSNSVPMVRSSKSEPRITTASKRSARAEYFVTMVSMAASGSLAQSA